jgi:hypothetical protein
VLNLRDAQQLLKKQHSVPAPVTTEPQHNPLSILSKHTNLTTNTPHHVLGHVELNLVVDLTRRNQQSGSLDSSQSWAHNRWSYAAATAAAGHLCIGVVLEQFLHSRHTHGQRKGLVCIGLHSSHQRHNRVSVVYQLVYLCAAPGRGYRGAATTALALELRTRDAKRLTSSRVQASFLQPGSSVPVDAGR